MKNYHYCHEKKLFISIILQQSPLDMEPMRCMETLVGKMRGKGVKVQHMVNVEKAIEEFDMKTMCNTKHNEALKIFIVSSGKDIVALSLGADNLIFSIEGNNFAWALLVALSYYYVFDQSFCAAYCQILYLMQCFILGDMRKVVIGCQYSFCMWMNTHKSEAKYSKGFNPVRQSLEHELQDGTSTSNNRTELDVSNGSTSTSTSMISRCTAN